MIISRAIFESKRNFSILFFSRFLRCLTDEPEERITSKDALKHPLFQYELKPSVRDMAILPSNVLRLIDILGDETQYSEGELDGTVTEYFVLIKIPGNHAMLFIFSLELLKDIREEAEKYGKTLNCYARGGHAYVEFQEASASKRACQNLNGRTFCDKTVVAVFYPVDLWSKSIFV